MTEDKVRDGMNPGNVDISFNGLLDKALAHEEGDQKVEPKVDAVVDDIKVEDIKVEPQKRYIELDDNTFVKTKLDGEEVEIGVKEYQQGIQREALWTKRMQTLADQRKQTENEIVQAYAILQQQALNVQAQQAALARVDPTERLLEALGKKREQEPKADEMATIGDIQKVLARELAAKDQQYGQALGLLQQQNQQALANLQAKAVHQANAQKFTDGLQTILSEKDTAMIRKIVPNPEEAEGIIRFNVAKMNPQTIEQGLEFAKGFVQSWVGTIKKEFQSTQKQDGAQRVRESLEPSRGTQVTLKGGEKPPTIFRKDGSVDFQSITKRAHDMLTTLDV